MVVYAWSTQVYVWKRNLDEGEKMGMGGKETSLLLYHFVPFDFFNHV